MTGTSKTEASSSRQEPAAADHTQNAEEFQAAAAAAPAGVDNAYEPHDPRPSGTLAP